MILPLLALTFIACDYRRCCGSCWRCSGGVVEEEEVGLVERRDSHIEPQVLSTKGTKKVETTPGFNLFIINIILSNINAICLSLLIQKTAVTSHFSLY